MITATPVAATVVFSNGDRKPVAPDIVPDLFDAVYSLTTRRTVKPVGDADDGGDWSPKPLDTVGGRTEFERWTQRDILAWLKAAEQPDLMKVMLVGDSIRMRLNNATGYALHAYRHLLGKVNLIHIPHNCGGTRGLLRDMEEWLSAKPNLIHVNAGLHDLALSRSGKAPKGYQDIPTYQSNLKTIFSMMSNARACVIWALNTPVDDEWHRLGDRSLLRNNADVVEYNQASAAVAREFGLPVNDLYTPLVEAGVRKVLLPDGVHLSHLGSTIAGRATAEAVLNQL